MAKTAIYPVLSTSATYLTNKHDITAAIMAFFIYNPGATSSSHPSMEISFRTIASELGHAPDLIVNRLEQLIPAVINKYFPNIVVDANFTTSVYDPESDDGRYGITFDLRFIDPATGTIEPAILFGQLEVDGDVVTIHFLND